MFYRRINKQGNLVKFQFSECDLEIALTGMWNCPNGYVVGTYNGEYSIFHRVVMNAKKGEVVDHINGDTLDNRRSNLRVCSYSQNSKNQKISKRNKTGVVGVCMSKNGKYIAQIRSDGKDMYLGSFKTIEEAIKARKDAELKYFGKYRRYND